MTDRPILYSAPMVLAKRRGLKTQTRRTRGLDAINEAPHEWRCVDFDRYVHGVAIFEHVSGKRAVVRCPFGVVGDRLWTKETYRTAVMYDALPPRDIPTFAGIHYDADGEGSNLGKVRQSIFMRRWMSRLLDEITDLRVQRVQDISSHDAVAEGLAKLSKDGGEVWRYGLPDRDGMPGSDDLGWEWGFWRQSPVDAYEHLWCQVNGTDSWELNPHVWAVTFKPVEVERG